MVKVRRNIKSNKSSSTLSVGNAVLESLFSVSGTMERNQVSDGLGDFVRHANQSRNLCFYSALRNSLSGEKRCALGSEDDFERVMQMLTVGDAFIYDSAKLDRRTYTVPNVRDCLGYIEGMYKFEVEL